MGSLSLLSSLSLLGEEKETIMSDAGRVTGESREAESFLY
jgi:hypothetical protein